MKIENVLLIGGSGFVGGALANRLSTDAVQVTIPSRRPEQVRHLLLLPTVDVVQADVHDPATLIELMAGMDVVVNLVGVLHSRPGEPYGPEFATAHVDLPRKIVASCRAVGVPRLIHVSALGASAEAPSAYQRSKAAGEAVIRTLGDGMAWTILRPSLMFGPGDHLLTLFARLLRRFPVIPLAGADTRFQPVFVDDVAEVVCRAMTQDRAVGEVYELAGPTVYTLREIVAYVGRLIHRRRPILALPESVAMVEAALMEHLPHPLISRDNLRSLRVDNVARGAPLPFAMTPTPMEAVAPLYVAGIGPHQRLHPLRSAA